MEQNQKNDWVEYPYDLKEMLIFTTNVLKRYQEILEATQRSS